MDDDMNIVFNLLDIGAYGYGAGYYFENFELEGIAGDAAAKASIGTDGLNASMHASIASGSVAISFGSIGIRFEGYVGGSGFDWNFRPGKKIGFSFIDIVGGGVYLEWN